MTTSKQSQSISTALFATDVTERMDVRLVASPASVDVNWSSVRLHSLESPDFEVFWILIRRPVMPRNVSHKAVGVVYHPPGAKNGPMSDYLISCVESTFQAHPYAGVVILGDFNSLFDKPIRDYPLKQLVNQPTRGKSVLDKIFTNISDWYSTKIIPAVGSSDHCSVIMLPADMNYSTRNHHITVNVRSNSTNGKNLLAHALIHHDWQTPEELEDIDSKVAYFNSSVTAYLDFYLPIRTISRCINDKPWVADQFRRLIRCRQYAWTSGNRTNYNRLRNAVNRLAKQLRSRYYNKCVSRLRNCNSQKWWQETKKSYWPGFAPGTSNTNQQQRQR
jgi:hypothetical protein